MRRVPFLRMHLPVLVTLCLTGAGSGTAGTAGQPVHVTLRVDQVMQGGARRALLPGDTLHSGDSFVMTVGVDRPAYVYVTQTSADGGHAVLFPLAGEEERPVTPGAPTSIPRTGQSFGLDDTIGVENLYLVASARPLAQVDRWTYQHLGLSREPPGDRAVSERAGAHASTAARDPPEPVTVRERGTRLVTRDKALRVATDGAGVAVVRFWFRHERGAK